jgi:hypothetical protein
MNPSIASRLRQAGRGVLSSLHRRYASTDIGPREQTAYAVSQTLVSLWSFRHDRRKGHRVVSIAHLLVAGFNAAFAYSMVRKYIEYRARRAKYRRAASGGSHTPEGYTRADDNHR